MKNSKDNQRSKSSINSKNGSMKKTSSAPITGNGSIVAMFQRQKEKWDTMWKLADGDSEGNNPCPSSISSKSISSSTSSSSSSLSKADKQIENFKEIDQNSNFEPSCGIISRGCDVKLDAAENSGDIRNKNLDSDILSSHKEIVGTSTEENAPYNQTATFRLSLKRKRPFPVGEAFNGSQDSASSAADCEKTSVASSFSSSYGILSAQPCDLQKSFSDDAAFSSVDTDGSIYESLLSNDFELGDSKDDSEMVVKVSEASKNIADYYVDNFSLVLKVVLEDEYYADLFDESDKEAVGIFQNVLSENARRLYVRLFLRKHKWLRRGKIIYPLIAEDLTETLRELTETGLLSDESDLSDLEETILCLPAPELRSLAKSLKMTLSSKTTLAEAVVRHVRRCDSSNFFAQAERATEKMTMKKAKGILGSCYKLVDRRRSVFIRATMLFGLHNTLGDDESYGQQLIFQMLMTQIGRQKYPKYKVLRKSRIFADRRAVIRYAEALQMESELCQCLERKDYDQCYALYVRIKEIADVHLGNQEAVSLDSALPIHLRAFTSGAIYVRLLTYGVEVLQFLKKYEDAVAQLQRLLDQDVYHPDYRGRWYDRLALNLDFHLKKPLVALEAIRSSLIDGFVRTGHRYNLLLRAKKICSSSAIKKSAPFLWVEFQNDPMNSVVEAPTVTITRHQLYRDVPGVNTIWVSSDSNDANDVEAKVTTRVEEVALRYYAENGYPEGIHGEGATFRCLFALFLWDILFMDGIEDVFYDEYQTHPLDITTDSFFLSREDAINDCFALIRGASDEELCEIVAGNWTQHKDTACFGIAWDLFRNLDHVLGLVSCFGGPALAGIFDRMARMMRSVTGGVPDLVVWNPESRKFKIVEVKGPGDRLSSKQILWLDYLLGLGVDVEVCLVRAVGGKALSNTK